SRIRVPAPGLTAGELLCHVVLSQRRRHPNDGVEAVCDRFARGEVLLADGTPLTATTPVLPGQDVYFYRMPAPEEPVPFPVETVYEDERILVVNKPPFLAVTPRGAHITETVLTRLRVATGNSELSPAHRLDRLTGGLLLLTKQAAVRGAYQGLFDRREVVKTYRAVAASPASGGAVTEVLAIPGAVGGGMWWRSRIEKTVGDLRARTVPGPVNAVTEVLSVRLFEPGPETADLGPEPAGLVHAEFILRPHTGKTHQLRLHMAEAGFPILGDPLYAPDSVASREPDHPEFVDDYDHPLQLTAFHLAFVDPVSGEEREFRLQ
ncbi:MAG: pseudouridine synthase, partial [Corynebacterium sp.]|nr:pseudouridine synthase [Corynebacterium sp.]